MLKEDVAVDYLWRSQLRQLGGIMRLKHKWYVCRYVRAFPILFTFTGQKCYPVDSQLETSYGLD